MSQSSATSDPLAPALPELGDLVGDDLVEASEILASQADAGSGAYNTPIAITENSSQLYGHSPKDANSRYHRYAQEGRDFMLGPMPPRDFLDTFCACSDADMANMPPTIGAFSEVPSSASSESAIYKPLIDALNHVPDKTPRCPGYKFRDTSKDADSAGNGIMKPDVICYAEEHLTRVQLDKPTDSPLRSRAHMGFAAFFIEVKKGPSSDFFQDPPPSKSSRGRDLQKQKNIELEYGQNISYASEIFARQHRCHCFSISMSGSCARLMLWDRSSAITTRSFDIKEEPEILCEFVWRFAHMSEGQRGLDMTVEAASKSEEADFEEAIRAHVKTQLDLLGVRLQARVYEHYQADAVSAIRMFSIDPANPQVPRESRLLVSRPLVSPLSATGRATRVYWAVEADTRKVVYLKDTWRFDGTGAEEEGAVLASLVDAGVSNIPTVIAHGHVPTVVDTASSEEVRVDHAVYQSTRAHAFTKKDWVCDVGLSLETIVKYSHYRLVLPIAGYTLSQIAGTSELLHTGLDMLIALLNVFRKAKRFHRDVNVGSIILFKNKGEAKRTGYLIDWDLSWKIGSQDPLAIAKRPRDATWQFMSIDVLSNDPALDYRIQDDMESLLYVVWYCALRWLPHSASDNALLFIFTEMFDVNQKIDNTTSGGGGKVGNAAEKHTTAYAKFENTTLHRFLNQLLDLHGSERTTRMGNIPAPTKFTSASLAGNPPDWAKPMTVAQFWRDFLASNPLPLCDRVARTLSNESRTLRDDDSHPATIPSMPASTVPLKRPADRETWDVASGLKSALLDLQAQEPEEHADAPPRKKQRAASVERGRDTRQSKRTQRSRQAPC